MSLLGSGLLLLGGTDGLQKGEVAPVTPQVTGASGMRQMAAEAGPSPTGGAPPPPPAHACEVKRPLRPLTCVIWQPLAHILWQGRRRGRFQIPQWQRARRDRERRGKVTALTLPASQLSLLARQKLRVQTLVTSHPPRSSRKSRRTKVLRAQAHGKCGGGGVCARVCTCTCMCVHACVYKCVNCVHTCVHACVGTSAWWEAVL